MKPRNDPPVDLERRLADVLFAEASTIQPAGDGLARIRERIEQRRSRLRWLRPTFVVATAGALAVTGAVIFGLAQTGTDTLGPGPDRFARPTATSAASPPSSASAPRYPIWPFTSGPQVARWQRGGGPVAEPWRLDPVQTATRFVAELGVTDLTVIDRETGPEPGGWKVVLGRRMTGDELRAVTVVHLTPYGGGPTAPWVVRYAGAYHLKIVAPERAAVVAPSFSVIAKVDGVDQTIAFSLWSASARTPLAPPVRFTGGTDAAPTARLSYTTALDPIGFVVAMEHSPAGGAVVELAAEAVTFPLSRVRPAPTPTGTP